MNTAPPRVTAAAFEYAQLPHCLSFMFSHDLSGTISLSALEVWNLTSESHERPSALAYDCATNRAIFRFAGQIRCGRYRATLLASRIADSDGRQPEQDFEFDFFFLAGDANHDGKVDFLDLQIVAANYHRSGVSFAEGDLNYDGRVDFADLMIVKRNYLRALPGAAVPVKGTPPHLVIPKLKQHRRHRRF